MPIFRPQWIVSLLFVLAIQVLTGCASGPNPIDPWEKSNRFFFDFDNAMDKAVFKPASDVYVKIIPKPVRRGIGNGFDNLQYFDVILNDFLQGKWQQGWSDAGRMALNSTVGIAGFFDVASPCGMPSHENDFGVTLGVWGAKPGPYLVLPLFGPSSYRDVPGIAVGYLDNPLTWVDMEWYVSFSVGAVQALDARSRAERYFKFRNAVALDDYVFVRDAYLQYRRRLIGGENATVDQSMYDEDPDTQPSTQSATQPATQAETRPAP